MRIGREHVGPGGFLVLSVAGVAALGLAVSGYGHGGVVTGSGGLVSSAQPAGAGGTQTSRASGGSGRSTPATTPGTSPTTSGPRTTTTTTPPASSSTPAQKLGPSLASSQYAPYAYQIYPGTPSAQAQAALSGIDFHVTPGPTSFSVTVAAAGSSQGATPTVYPNGDRIYVIEASFGDDSGGVDYSLGDDSIVATNAAGRMIQ